eukprot:5359282-Prymnesium_polylepis.1
MRGSDRGAEACGQNRGKRHGPNATRGAHCEDTARSSDRSAVREARPRQPEEERLVHGVSVATAHGEAPPQDDDAHILCDGRRGRCARDPPPEQAPRYQDRVENNVDQADGGQGGEWRS